jgi:hypothetical protein
MPIKRLPPWNPEAASELIAECFDAPAERERATRTAERLAAVVHTLNTIQPEDHLDLLDEAGLTAPWRITVTNTATGSERVVEGEQARQMVWFLDEMWQDAPLAMSPVRYQRLGFRIIEEYFYAPLRSVLAGRDAEVDEFAGDLLTLIFGEHRNNYVFMWWQANHGRFRPAARR